MNIQTARPFLLVTGMHRSGTSMLMRLCNLLGVTISERLVPALPHDNETGFWEPLDVVETNERILEALGTTHLSLKPIPENGFLRQQVLELADQQKALVLRDFQQVALPGMKDPRFSRLLPLWIPLLKKLGFTPHVLIAVRNPLEVARSLEKRNQLPIADGLKLWQQYSQEVERYSRGCPRAFVNYEAVLTDWQGTLKQAFLQAQLPWQEPSADTVTEIQSFMRPDLRHQQVSEQVMNEQVLPATIKLYHQLLKGCSEGEVDAEAIDALAA